MDLRRGLRGCAGRARAAARVRAGAGARGAAVAARRDAATAPPARARPLTSRRTPTATPSRSGSARAARSGAPTGPRGGPWEAVGGPRARTSRISSGIRAVVAAPRRQFVAVWLADRGDGRRIRCAAHAARPAATGARRAPSPRIGCCPGISGARGERRRQRDRRQPRTRAAPSSNTKPRRQRDLGSGRERRRPGPGSGFAAGPDGSAVAVASRLLQRGEPCVVCRLPAARRPVGRDAEAARVARAHRSPASSVAATPELRLLDRVGRGHVRRRRARSRRAGVAQHRPPVRAGRRWERTASRSPTCPPTLPGCDFGNCFDLVVGPDGGQVAVWQQSGAAGERIVGRAARGSGGVLGRGGERRRDRLRRRAGPHAAVTSTGIPVVAWGSAGQTTERIADGSHRTPPAAGRRSSSATRE